MRPAFAALVLLAGFWSSSATAASWIHLSTSEFQMYSTNPEKESRELIGVLGSVQAFMRTVGFVHASLGEHPRTPICIVALSSRAEYAPFRLNPSAFGYFRHGRLCNYIVLQDIRPEHRPAAMHEYIHLLFRQAGLTLPLWLNEGLADFYSSFDQEGSQARVGGALPGRTRILERRSLIDLPTLFAVDHKSRFYNNGEDIPIFYAESWALAHMLAMDPDYAPGLFQLIQLLSKGLTPAMAFEQAYGKSISEIEMALRAYVPAISQSSPKLIAIDTPVIPVFCWPEEVQSELLLDETRGTMP